MTAGNNQYTGKYTLIKQLKENVKTTAHIMSDELPAYKYLYDYGFYNHHSVNHSMSEYAFRYNYRNLENIMFDVLLNHVVVLKPV